MGKVPIFYTKGAPQPAPKAQTPPEPAPRHKPDYSRLQRKIFLQMILFVFASVVLLLFMLSQLPHGFVSRVGIWLLQRLPGQDYQSALALYNAVVRQNMSLILVAAVLAIFLLFMRFSLTWFAKYFREIDTGVGQLMAGTQQEILLCPELYEMERKLNAARETLEKRALEARLAEQRKDDLVMYLAHDIRTPLTSVIGYLSLLDEAPDMPPAQRARYTHITLEKALRLETLVNEFFEITRYNLSQLPLETGPIDLYYMLVQLIDEFYPILQKNQNTAVLHAPETLAVTGDAVKLARVFNNLLKNAALYSTPGTAIDITATQAEDGVVVRFANQGRTIPAEKLDLLFEKFYRLDEARASGGGAGLGLAIAREIVARHGGAIAAQSENGVTTFTVTLPAVPPHPNLSKS